MNPIEATVRPHLRSHHSRPAQPCSRRPRLDGAQQGGADRQPSALWSRPLSRVGRDHDHAANDDAIMASQHADHYLILGVDPHATQAQISHAYRTLLRQHHPDTRTVGHDEQNAAADANLQQVLTAYGVLHDPRRRAAYDRQRASRPVRISPPMAQTPPRTIRPPVRAGPVHWQVFPRDYLADRQPGHEYTALHDVLIALLQQPW
jgi:hypothetical protein